MLQRAGSRTGICCLSKGNYVRRENVNYVRRTYNIKIKRDSDVF